MDQSKKMLRFACYAALFYCALVLADTLLTYSWLQDNVKLARGLVRTIGFSVVAIMAVRGDIWSERILYWGSLVLSIFGLLAFSAFFVPEFWIDRPYPWFDRIFLSLAPFSLFATFCFAWAARKKKKAAVINAAQRSN